MATIVCPMHIRKLFKGGIATESQKRRARAVALAWIKQQVGNMRPGDKIIIPNADTGELEEWSKESGSAIN